MTSKVLTSRDLIKYRTNRPRRTARVWPSKSGGLIPGQQQTGIIMEDLYLVSNRCVLSWRTYTWSAMDVYYHGGLIPGQQRMCIIMEDLYRVSNGCVLSWRTYTWSATDMYYQGVLCFLYSKDKC